MSIDTVSALPPYTTTAFEKKAPAILQLVPHFDGGGAARLALEYGAAIQAAGGQTWIGYEQAAASTHELSRFGIRGIEMKLASRNPLTGFNVARRVARFAAESKIDIIHAQSASLAVIGHAAAKRAGCRLVTTFHDGPGSVAALSKRARQAFLESDLVITLSHVTADEIARALPALASRLSVVPFGIDLTRFDPGQVTAPRVVQLANQWRVPDDIPVIMAPATFQRGKGHSLLLEALAQIRDLDLRCILVGPDPDGGVYRKQLEREVAAHQLQDRVLIAEDVRDMPAALMLADLIVAPYLEPATYNRVLIEAQALGRPVVASDFPAAREVLDGSSMAWLTAPGDAQSLGWAIRDALALPLDEREARTPQVIENLRPRADRDVMAAQVLSLYNSLLMDAHQAA
ncbi:glycosyltransferase involved in cell wall biosynthesis [Dongia mobilis]|uniref:Glycosyltransferase involved in cell wall biosynthesis n=1 Tax=Dongia mobilis TaxID=578943 RepID=A0A4R6WYY7_9PROT|nr:glycosyltransferase [Dongia mobilis]TDQ85469.1 glycosyltransferase involved in cell wall biosynthesis [Dongia mobilis]